MECRLDRITVHYEVFGQGRPIIMFHGGQADHREMVYEMEPIFSNREGWKRFYPDLPGYGKSPGPEWITNKDQVLQVVEDFIDKTIPGTRFVAGGTSYGAYIVRALVNRRGAMMDGALLSVPAIIWETSKTSLPQRILLHQDKALVDRARSEMEMIATDLEDYAVVQNQTVLDYLRVLDHCVFDEGFVKKIKGPLSFEVDNLSEPFPAPTLFITGRQDHLVGYQDAWKILENYPRATFAVLDRAGHLVRGEQPELWSLLVGEWLNRVEDCIRNRGAGGWKM